MTNLNFRYQQVKNLKKIRHFCYVSFKSGYISCAINFSCWYQLPKSNHNVCCNYMLLINAMSNNNANKSSLIFASVYCVSLVMEFFLLDRSVILLFWKLVWLSRFVIIGTKAHICLTSSFTANWDLKILDSDYIQKINFKFKLWSSQPTEL